MVFGGGYSEYRLDSLRTKGAEIGKGVKLYSDDIFIDPSRPWLLKIGEYTKITHHCIILTHDYSLSVLRRVYREWIGEGAVTSIGSNCFIGMGTVILMGSKIGNNVIVGAGSVVHGEIPDNVVVAGNPAKIICSLDDHYRRRKEKTIKEAVNCAKRYHTVYNKLPMPNDLAGFKFLFCPRDKKVVKEYGLSFYCTGDEPSEVEKAFYETVPYWNNFEALLKDSDLI